MSNWMFPQGIPKSKRVFDLVTTGLLLILLSPVILVISVLVRLMLGAPIIFSQRRPGYQGKPFTIYKFRSMNNRKDAEGNLLPDEDRLTRFGKVLRATSLDELPELVNVLRGEMSLVGPRPLLMAYLARYNQEQLRRHDVLPGITGWAQVNGRNALGWEEKFKLDIWYVDHWSFGLDLQILTRTIWAVIQRSGIHEPGQATASEFMGTQDTTGKGKEL